MSQHENLIQERLRKLGNVTADFLAQLSGVPGSRISQAFRNIRDLDNVHVVEIDKILRDLEELATAVAPIPVSFTSPKVVRAILEERRNGNLWIDVRVAESVWSKQDTQDRQ